MHSHTIESSNEASLPQSSGCKPINTHARGGSVNVSMQFGDTAEPTVNTKTDTAAENGGGTAAEAPSASTTTTAASNPIGTTAAKLLKGETQDQVNALQKLKYDAWDITLARNRLTSLKAAGGSDTDIKGAEASLESARTSYKTDLSESSEKFSLTGSRINRYLTGGAHPVPDSALIPSSTDDVSDFIKTMTEQWDQQETLESSRASTSNSGKPA
jgi:hypothetical protein